MIAPDLQGSGVSAALAESDGMDAYAAATWRLRDGLGFDRLEIRGIGFGASLAVEMAAAEPARCAALAIDGPLLPSDDERAELIYECALCAADRDRCAWGGGQWFRMWQMLRDSTKYWPWYDSRRVALRRVADDFGADALHEWPPK